MSNVPYIQEQATIFTNNNDVYEYGLTFNTELVINGDFSSGLTSWSADAGWTHINSGTDNPYARATGAIADADLSQNVATEIGELYKVEFKLVQPTGTNYQLRFSLGGYTHSWIGSFPGEGARQYEFYFYATTTGGDLNIRATIASGSNIGIKDISVKKVLTTGTFISQFGEAEIWPRKGTLEGLTGDQSPWWIGD